MTRRVKIALYALQIYLFMALVLIIVTFVRKMKGA
jgi:hypothetical protein